MNISLLQVGKIAGLVFVGILLGVIIAGKTDLRIAGQQSQARLDTGGRDCSAWLHQCLIQNPDNPLGCANGVLMCLGAARGTNGSTPVGSTDTKTQSTLDTESGMLQER